MPPISHPSSPFDHRVIRRLTRPPKNSQSSTQSSIFDPTSPQVAKIIGRMWKDLTEEDKRRYLEKAERDKAEYYKEIRTYISSPEPPEEMLPQDPSSSTSTSNSSSAVPASNRAAAAQTATTSAAVTAVQAPTSTPAAVTAVTTQIDVSDPPSRSPSPSSKPTTAATTTTTRRSESESASETSSSNSLNVQSVQRAASPPPTNRSASPNYFSSSLVSDLQADSPWALTGSIPFAALDFPHQCSKLHKLTKFDKLHKL